MGGEEEEEETPEKHLCFFLCFFLIFFYFFKLNAFKTIPGVKLMKSKYAERVADFQSGKTARGTQVSIFMETQQQG